jgi:hypothetical protein
MIFQIFNELDFEHIISVVILTIYSIINLILGMLFLKKYKDRGEKSVKLLAIMQFIAVFGLLCYILRNILVLNDLMYELFKNGYIMVFLISPFLLMIFSNEIFGEKEEKKKELLIILIIILVSALLFIFSYVDFVSYLLYALILFVIFEVLYNIVYVSLRVRKRIPNNDSIGKIGLLLISISGLFFLGFLIFIGLYDIIEEFSLKITAFIFYGLFTIDIYLGYYFPNWLKKRIKFND